LIRNGLRKRGFEHAGRAKSPGNLEKFVGANRLKRMKPRMQVQNGYTDAQAEVSAEWSDSARRVAAELTRLDVQGPSQSQAADTTSVTLTGGVCQEVGAICR
jgi:hypothetical protein